MLQALLAACLRTAMHNEVHMAAVRHSTFGRASSCKVLSTMCLPLLLAYVQGFGNGAETVGDGHLQVAKMLVSAGSPLNGYKSPVLLVACIGGYMPLIR